MGRVIVIAAALAAVLAAPAGAAPGKTTQNGRVLLMPGVTYERQVQFTTHGPVAVHVLNAPKPGGLWRLSPHLSNGAIVGRERVTAMQKAASRDATVAGVNGDLFTWADGRPSGILMRGGQLLHPPLADRSSVGIAADGTLRVERVRFFGTWRGNGQRRPMGLNASPGPNGVALFTSAWGPATPAQPGSVEATVFPLPGAATNVDFQAPVVGLAQNGNVPIPPGGGVLVARGTAAQRLVEEAPVGTAVTFRLLLDPGWGGEVPDAIGGGPALVREGKPIFRANELFTTNQLARHPRTGVGQLADGRIVLVVVDGRRPGYSVGMTNFELAQTLVRLGAVTASGLDAGGSSTMAFDGTLLNRPSDPGGERAVSEGLFVRYEGVYAPTPSTAVLSPNGDGVDESVELAYRLPRPARVRVALVGPDKAERVLEDADKGPGAYRFAWDGSNADGSPAVEGSWRLAVSATDDLGRPSSADRYFALDRTLAGLAVAPALVKVGRGGRLTATFTLAREAQVTATVRTPTGAIVATVGRRKLAAGPQRVVWNGRTGRAFAHTGRYVLHVRAVSAVGKAELRRTFALRRLAPPKKTRRD